MELESVLASSCRRKILRTLSKQEQILMMDLVRAVNSTYNEVDRNIDILEQEELIIQRRSGHRRIIQLNFKNEKTLIILKILKILEQTYSSTETRFQLVEEQ